MAKTVSYRVDGLSMTLTPDEKDFKRAFNARGYILREPGPDDKVRVQKGYSPENALMLDIQVGEKEDEIFTLTVQRRTEKDETESGFIAMSGGQLDYIPYEDMIRTYSDWVKGTRIDVAADLEYQTTEEMINEQLKLCKRVGFDPNRGGYTQNSENDIRGGRKNRTKPIQTASMIASKGLTLYIGGRQSRFMVRAYDKSAEVLANTGEEIPPTLRIEAEVKQELANGVIKEIIKTDEMGHDMAPRLWHTLTDDFITFIKRVNTETLAEVMSMRKAEVITLDYSKLEGVSLEYEQWLRRQAKPKFEKLYKNLNDKINSLNRIGFLTDKDKDEIMQALSNEQNGE